MSSHLQCQNSCEGSEFLADQLKALGHPVRLGLVLQLLDKHDCCCGQLCDCFDQSQSTISQHLAVLKDAGLVESEKQGNRVKYSLAPHALRDLEHFITDLNRTLSQKEAAPI